MDLLCRPVMDLGSRLLEQLHDHYRREYIRLVIDALRAGVITNDRAISLMHQTWKREFPDLQPPSVRSSWDSLS